MSKIKELKALLPKEYQDYVEPNLIMESEGPALEKVERVMDEWFNQQFVSSATWMLSSLERFVDVQSSQSEMYALRRARVENKLSNLPPITRLRIRDAINRYLLKPTSTVRMIPGEYAFEINIPAEDLRWIVDILKDIEKIKPAHLAYEIKMIRESKNHLYFGGAIMKNDFITIYPEVT